MVDQVPRKEGPHRNRLESWLVRKLQGGVLKGLPRYYPLRGCGGECPEQYAQALLAGLRTAEGDRTTQERLKDDGRAFRSWAEAGLAGNPYGGDGRDGYLARGFAG